MSKELDAAIDRFEQLAWAQLRTWCFDPSTNPRCFHVQIQAQALAGDLLGLALIVRDLYVAAVKEVAVKSNSDRQSYEKDIRDALAARGGGFDDEEFRAFLARRAPDAPMETISHEKFGAGFKAFLYAVRAFQDGLYRVGLGVEGNPPGGRGSTVKNAMQGETGLLNAKNPVGKILSQSVPEYRAWVRDMRNLRNKIKNGLGVGFQFGTNFITGKTTVALQMKLATHQEPTVIAISDIVTAIEMSTNFTNAIVSVGVANGALASRFS